MKKKFALLLASFLFAVLLFTVGTAALADSSAVAFVSYANGTDKNDGLTDTAPRRTLSKALELLPDGGTLVMTKKVFIGDSYTVNALGGDLLITSLYDGADYTGVADNVFKMKAGATLTFTSNVTFDNILLYNEYQNANTIHVTNGATLTIGKNVTCRPSPTGNLYMSITADEGSTVILNGGIFQTVSGKGEIINNGATLLDDEGETDDAVAFVAYMGGTDASAGRSPQTARKTLSKALELLPDGGTLVMTKKVFIGGNHTVNALGGDLLITSLYKGVNYTETAGVDDKNVPNNVFKMAAGATLTFTSNVTFDNILLYNEYQNANTIHVTNGATLTIGKNVTCRPSSTGDLYMSITVDEGSTVILNGGIFQTVSGKGEIINNGATVLGDEEENEDVAFLAYHTGAGGNDTNTGTTVNAPRKTLSKTITLLPNGGTLVVVNKLFIGSSYTLPKLNGTLTLTSLYNGVDYTANAGTDNNGLSNNVFKMAAGAVLTFQSDVVMDNMILYNEYANANTIRVTGGATLTIGEDLTCVPNSAGIYMQIQADAGSTVILNGGIFAGVSGEGRVINKGAILHDHTHIADAGTITREATCTHAGEIVYGCRNCAYIVSVERIPMLEHTYEIVTPGTPATCTQTGTTDHKVCTTCGTHVYSARIPAEGHCSGDWKLEVPPTDSTLGVEKLYCVKCGALLSRRSVAKYSGFFYVLQAKLTSAKGTFYVTFNTLGGTGVNAQTVKAGEQITLPDAPSKTGYVFEGWYTDCNGFFAFDPATPIRKNITLYAKWSRIQ